MMKKAVYPQSATALPPPAKQDAYPEISYFPETPDEGRSSIEFTLVYFFGPANFFSLPYPDYFSAQIIFTFFYLFICKQYARLICRFTDF